jgi:DNA-3-methyladenine glycosylase I
VVTYCSIIRGGELDDPLNKRYHDTQYGYPLRDDNELFGRLLLEINQAGLSWTTILKKQESFRAAYSGFSIDRVAGYGPEDKTRLLNDPGVIRNRLKVEAAIGNARKLIEIRDEFGSFAAWLDHHHPLSKDQWVKLFRRTLRFTGGEIVNEFLLSTGYLPGAHEEECPVYRKIRKLKPPWTRR